MLPASRRIRRSREFRSVLGSGNRSSTRTVVVHVGPLLEPTGATRARPESVTPRAGFIVGRAVGGSVVRSRVTRRLRHLLAVHLDEVPPGLGVVVRALPAAADADSAQLAADVTSGLRRCLRRVGHDPAPLAGASR